MRLPIAAVLLLATSTLFAQTTNTTDHKAASKKAAASSSQQAPKAAPESAKLMKMFGGKWTVTAKNEASNFGPADSGSGTENNHAGPGGNSLIVNTTMKFEHMGPFAGHGVMYWDPEAKNYTGIWCDNWGPCSNDGAGNWDGDKLVFNSDMKYQGQTMKVRQTYSDFTADSFTFVLEMGDASGNMKPWMTFNYKRAGTIPAPTGLSSTPK